MDSYRSNPEATEEAPSEPTSAGMEIDSAEREVAAGRMDQEDLDRLYAEMMNEG